MNYSIWVITDTTSGNMWSCIYGTWLYEKWCVGWCMGIVALDVLVDMTNTLAHGYCLKIFCLK